MTDRTTPQPDSCRYTIADAAGFQKLQDMVFRYGAIPDALDNDMAVAETILSASSGVTSLWGSALARATSASRVRIHWATSVLADMNARLNKLEDTP